MIYRNDAIARKRNLSPAARLEFHQTESGSTLTELHTWLARQFEDRLVEPNSSLGGAIAYMLKHWDKLTLFLRVPGAPLDNNICELAANPHCWMPWNYRQTLATTGIAR